MDDRLDEFLDGIGEILKNKRRRASFATYAYGLLSDGERKSMEPIAARASGDRATVVAHHERLVHFLADSPWKDQPIREFSARFALEPMVERSPILSWIVDDTGFLKKGIHSPGVQRQYTGSAGKVTNCQIGVSLVLANKESHLAVDFDLYLPESWTEDRSRCAAAHIPDDVGYRPKWQIALELIGKACKADYPRGTLLADSGYGDVPAFRAGLIELKLMYAVGVHHDAKVCRLGKSGRPGVCMTVKELAMRKPTSFRQCSWRNGTKNRLHSRFNRYRVIVQDKFSDGKTSQWLLVEWPENEKEPTRFTLSNLPASISMKSLVRQTKERWRIEASYLELKEELGLDHFEGRSYVGWHHHISVVLSCQAFLVAERVRSFPPSA